MINVFDKQGLPIKQITTWDPALVPGTCYLIDVQGKVFLHTLSRPVRLELHEWPAPIRAARMILGFGAL